jgi:hypothetical protein
MNNCRFVIKPISASGGEEVKILLGKEIVQMKIKDTMPKIIEEAIQVVQEYHCDAVVRNGQIVFHVISQYIRPVLSTIGSYHGSIHLPLHNSIVKPIVTMLKTIIEISHIGDAVFHMEVLESDKKLSLGEIAIRPAGGGIATSLMYAFGVDLWGEYFRLHLELPSLISKKTKKQSTKFIFGCCGLPAQSGKIIHMTSKEELQSIIDVYAVEQLLYEGQIGKNKHPSVNFSYIVYFKCQNESSVASLIDQVNKKYYIVVE